MKYAEDEIINGEDKVLIANDAWYIADCANRLYKLADDENSLTAWLLKSELNEIQECLDSLRGYLREEKST